MAPRDDSPGRARPSATPSANHCSSFDPKRVCFPSLFPLADERSPPRAQRHAERCGAGRLSHLSSALSAFSAVQFFPLCRLPSHPERRAPYLFLSPSRQGAKEFGWQRGSFNGITPLKGAHPSAHGRSPGECVAIESTQPCRGATRAALDHATVRHNPACCGRCAPSGHVWVLGSVYPGFHPWASEFAAVGGVGRRP